MSARYTPDNDDYPAGVTPIGAARRDRTPVIFEDISPVVFDDPARLPAVTDPAELVLEGEVVDRRAVTAVTVTSAVIRGIAAADNARRARRHGGYVAAGLALAVRRWRLTRSTSVYDEWIASARAAGDQAGALEWEGRRSAFLRDRHARRRDRAAGLVRAVTLLPKVVTGGAVTLGAVSVLVAVGSHHWGNIVLPVELAARVTSTSFAVVSAAWRPVMLSAPAVTLAALWYTGRRQALSAGSPGWLTGQPAADAGGGLVVTADTIVLALQNLPIPKLAKAFKDGWRPVFTTVPTRDGNGYEAEFSVPLGVTPEMIADTRPVLARNLHRDEIETWPSAGSPGYARLRVLDRGAVAKSAPEYPLLHEGQADVFEGVPGGVIARGDGALIPVVGNNGVLGGMMGQGKSNAARVLMLGCATDPLCGLDVFTFANNGDFDAYAPRLATYRKGLDDDVIVAAVDRLHELYRQVGEREQMLADLNAKKVTRLLAQQYPELRPHVSLFSECHELFGHPEYGEIAGELAVKTAKRARKTAEVLWFDTQSSRKSAIPPALVELVSVNCCFAVKSWRSNDGFLGDGSFAAGIRATELRPGRDRGTSLVTGISDAQWELLKWYFVEVNDDTGYDAAADVIARCMEALDPATTASGAASPAPASAPRDVLADIAAVIGDQRVMLADLPALLRDYAPTWPPYRLIRGTQIRGLLEAKGVRVLTTGNKPQLDPADLRATLTERE